MDLHQGQIQGFFEIPVDHMTAVPMLADHFRYKDFGGTPIVAVSADAGGVKLAKRFINRMPDADLAVLTKMRPEHNRAETMHFIGDVQARSPSSSTTSSTRPAPSPAPSTRCTRTAPKRST